MIEWYMVFGLRIITLPKLSKDIEKVFMILVFFMKKCLTLTFHWKKAYENMRNNTRKVLGVWNDHDYGLQNGDANFSNKNVTKKVFLDFLGNPGDLKGENIIQECIIHIILVKRKE
jgi:hypothetical protein